MATEQIRPTEHAYEVRYETATDEPMSVYVIATDVHDAITQVETRIGAEVIALSRKGVGLR